MPSYTEEDYKNDYALLPDMDAELVVENAEIRVAKSTGNEYLSIQWKVRDDVEQECQGRFIWENIYQDKNHPGEFDRKKIAKILSTVPQEERQNEFADNDELVQYINGLYVMAHIENKAADEWHDEDYNQIKYLSYKPTQHPAKKLGVNPTTEVKKQITKAYEVVEDDASLPF